MLDCSEITHTESKPQAIEKILHKYELEIRTHVKMEQQFKKLAEEAERKCEALKNEYSSISVKYNEMMIKLSDFAYANDTLLDENATLRRHLTVNKIEPRDSSKRASNPKQLSITKDKNSKNSRNNSTEFIKLHIDKLKKVH